MFLNPNPAAHPLFEHPGGLYPVLNATELLVHVKHKQLLIKIQRYSGLDEKDFAELYAVVINNFVEFAQALPIKIGGKLGGLMNYGLERGSMALEVYKEQAGVNFSARYAYAVFTMGLLVDVGLTVSQQKLMISNEHGEFIEEWSPFQGSVLAKGKYYKLRFVLNRWQILGKLSTTLLARQLMTEVGFLWISQDYELLQMWLAALAGEEGVADRTLMNLLQLVNKRLAGMELKDNLPHLTLHPTYPHETMDGEAFAAWLIDGINNGTIIINQPDSSVYLLPSGDFLLESRIFQQFGEEKKIDKWEAIMGQFNCLGFTKLGGKAVSFTRFYERFPERKPGGYGAKKGMGYFLTPQSPGSTKMHQGIVVKPDLILRGNFRAPPAIDLQPVNPEPIQETVHRELKSLIDKYTPEGSSGTKLQKSNLD